MREINGVPINWQLNFFFFFLRMTRVIWSTYDHMADAVLQQEAFVTVRFGLPNSVGIIVDCSTQSNPKSVWFLLRQPLFTQNIRWDVARQPVSLCHLSFFLLRGSLCGLSSRGTVALCSKEGNYHGKHWIAAAHKGQNREAHMAEWSCSVE